MAEASPLDLFFKLPGGLGSTMFGITKKFVSKFCPITINEYDDESTAILRDMLRTLPGF